jgi:hypothetical protein
MSDTESIAVEPEAQVEIEKPARKRLPKKAAKAKAPVNPNAPPKKKGFTADQLKKGRDQRKKNALLRNRHANRIYTSKSSKPMPFTALLASTNRNSLYRSLNIPRKQYSKVGIRVKAFNLMGDVTTKNCSQLYALFIRYATKLNTSRVTPEMMKQAMMQSIGL